MFVASKARVKHKFLLLVGFSEIRLPTVPMFKNVDIVEMNREHPRW